MEERSCPLLREEDIVEVEQWLNNGILDLRTTSNEHRSYGTINCEPENVEVLLVNESCCTRCWRCVVTICRWRNVATICRWRRAVGLVSLALVLWSAVLALQGPRALPPHGDLFQLAAVSVAAQVAGWAVGRFSSLPPLVGMLLAGLALRNIGAVNTDPSATTQAALRSFALVVILTRAGLGLNADALLRLKLMVLRLAVIPSLVEVVSSALMARWLFQMPWIWCFLLGSVLAAVSPAVVIPCLFSLQERGYGTDKDIPTLIVAAASIDDIIGVAGFRIVLSLIFSSTTAVSLTNKILEGPLSIIYGISFGLFWGILCGVFPKNDDEYVIALRTFLVAAGGACAIYGSGAIGYEGAGPLGCVVSAFLAAQYWINFDTVPTLASVRDNFAVLWTIFQPILFGLIGAQMDLLTLDRKTVELGIILLVVCLTVRMIVTIIVAAGGDLNWKERIFVAISWFPKATVQAAIGPVALYLAQKEQHSELYGYATVVLIVAVLAILLTAPLGAVLVTLSGPRLLQMGRNS